MNLPATRNTSDLALQMKFADTVASDRSASLLPEQYRGNRANVLIAVGLGASMGLSPAESLYRISVIKGKPTAGAELIAANVRRAGHKLRVQGDERSCTATIIRADDPDYPFAVTRDLDWAKGMGLAGNDNYKKQPGTMLQWRAITAVARLACPEALYGVTYTPDEMAEQGDAPQPAQKVTAAAFTKAPEPAPPADEPIEGEVVTAPAPDAQRRKMFALFSEVGMPDGRTDEGRDARLRFTSDVVGRDVESSSDLTADEVAQVVDALEADGGAA